MRQVLYTVLLIWPLGIFAQFGDQNEARLITGVCKLEPYQTGLKPDFSIDARRTLFQKRWVAVMGLKGGVQYKRIHRLGIGVYFLNTRVFDDDFNFDIDADEVEYEFRYSTLYYERVLYFSRKWEIGANLHFGGGTVRVFYQNPENPNDRIELDPVEFSTTELALYADYNFLYWLTGGVGFGYRGVFGAGKDIRNEFTSPIFVVNLQLKVFKLARSFYDEKVKYEF
jgi:hypothetical protein